MSVAGWIIERSLRDGSTVFDIGYRVNGRLVKRKGGATRRAAESTLILALAEIESGAIRDHTTETLAAYASRWLERRRPFVESGTLDAYRNDITFRIAPTLGAKRLRDITSETIEEAIIAMQLMKPRRGSANPTYSSTHVIRSIETWPRCLPWADFASARRSRSSRVTLTPTAR